VLSTVVIINIPYARAINIDEAEAYKNTYHHGKQTLHCLFISFDYCFVMSSVCNTIVLVKIFETVVYMSNTVLIESGSNPTRNG